MNLLKQLAIVGLVGALTSCGMNDDGGASGDGVITEKGTSECVDFPAPVSGEYYILKEGQGKIKKEYIEWSEKMQKTKMTLGRWGRPGRPLPTHVMKYHIKNNYTNLDSSTADLKSKGSTTTTTNRPLRYPIYKVCKEQKWSDGNVTFTVKLTTNGKTLNSKHTTVTPIYEIEDVNVVKNIGLGEFNTFVMKTTKYLHQSKGDMTPSVSRTWYDIETGIPVLKVFENGGDSQELMEYSKN